MQNLTGDHGAFARGITRVTGQVPGGAQTLRPGALPQDPQNAGKEDGHHHHLADDDLVVDGEAPALVPSKQQAGIQQEDPTADAMTAPGPDGQHPDYPLSKGHPDYPHEYPNIPKSSPGFRPDAFGKVDGGSDQWKRVRR